MDYLDTVRHCAPTAVSVIRRIRRNVYSSNSASRGRCATTRSDRFSMQARVIRNETFYGEKTCAAQSSNARRVVSGQRSRYQNGLNKYLTGRTNALVLITAWIPRYRRCAGNIRYEAIIKWVFVRSRAASSSGLCNGPSRPFVRPSSHQCRWIAERLFLFLILI